MKKLKRTFLKVDERIHFGEKKGSIVERYFDQSRFSIKNNFYFYIDYDIQPVPKKLAVYFIYLDKHRVEYIVREEFVLKERQPCQNGKNEIKIPVKIQLDEKELYKIKLEHLPTTNSSVYICISDL
jgi:hypothetical protein